MGIAISAGAGLLLGLGLMIWGWRERSARHQAERAMVQAGIERLAAVNLANHNHKRAGELEAEVVRRDEHLHVLRERLAAVREQVVLRATTETLKALIDAEGVKETI